MKALFRITYILLIALSCFYTANAQTNRADKKAANVAAISNIINTTNYVFKANFANPFRNGQSRALTSDYDLTVAKDTVIAFLPYFGRAYLADYNSATDGGIKFTTTKFDYKVTKNKKGSREILITLNNSSLGDPNAVKTMRLDVSPDGYASLQVISYNRDPISFEGMVQEREKPKSY